MPTVANGHSPPVITALSNPGNMYGLQVRISVPCGNVGGEYPELCWRGAEQRSPQQKRSCWKWSCKHEQQFLSSSAMDFLPGVLVQWMKIVLWLQERKVAVDSLLAVGRQLQEAQPALAERLVGRSDIPDQHSLDTFLQTVKAAHDVSAVRQQL